MSPDLMNKHEVIAFARRRGPGTLVVKYDNRTNYNICQKGDAHIWMRPNVDIIHEVRNLRA